MRKIKFKVKGGTATSGKTYAILLTARFTAETVTRWL